jgi:hypothetical protein
MHGQYDPERSWHILNHRMRVEQSSLVGKFGSIRGVGELESIACCEQRSYYTLSGCVSMPITKTCKETSDYTERISLQTKQRWKACLKHFKLDVRWSLPRFLLSSSFLRSPSSVTSQIVLLPHWKSLTPGSLIPQSPHFGAVPAFLM